MTAEQSVLVLGIVIAALFIALVSVGGKKKTDKSVGTSSSSAPHPPKATNRSQRRKR